MKVHGITITLNGPTTFSVRAPARFTATVDGAAPWGWVGPDGTLVVATDPTGELELEAQTVGRATVRVLACDEQNRIVQATQQLNVIA
ncbi:MAG: hypothetical protein ACRD2C_18190 [Acidimicrobiales bacterium]